MESHRETDRQAGSITALTMQRHQPTRVSVFLDGAFAFDIEPELVREWGLQIGGCLSVIDQERLRAADQLLAAHATALHYLAARPRTAHEVRQKLRRSGVAEPVTAHVIARLQTRGILDDTAYAHAYLPARLASRGYGPHRLRRELQQRGIGHTLVEEAMPQALAVEEVLAAARAHAAKRWPRLARVLDRVERRQKLWAFLSRRGFPAAIVQQVLTERMEEDVAAGDADPRSASAARATPPPRPPRDRHPTPRERARHGQGRVP